MNEKIRYGIIGTISALLIFGGVIVLTPDELDHAWYCDRNGRIGIFDHMSETNKSGYWLVDDVWKRATCTKSAWIPLREYCRQEGLIDCLIIKTTAKEDAWTGRYWCTDVCDEIYT